MPASRWLTDGAVDGGEIGRAQRVARRSQAERTSDVKVTLKLYNADSSTAANLSMFPVVRLSEWSPARVVLGLSSEMQPRVDVVHCLWK